VQASQTFRVERVASYCELIATGRVASAVDASAVWGEVLRGDRGAVGPSAQARRGRLRTHHRRRGSW
jgi:hypothetical protein